MRKDRTVPSNSPLIASRQLTFRYVVALLLIAAASATGFLTLYFSIKKEEAAATVINVAGRQRMLSQRIALFINQLQESPTETRLHTEALESIDLFEAAHKGLVAGDAEMELPGLQNSQTRDVYFGDIALDERMRAFVALARTAVAEAKMAGAINERLLDEINSDAAGPLLNALDSAVASFERESRLAIRNLEMIELTIFILTLLLLLAEVFVIFRPSVRRVSTAMQRMLDAEEASHKSARERQLVLDAVSHELRTPLGQIMHAIASTPPEDQSPAVQAQLTKINEGCDDIAGAITAVLNFVSLETSMNAPRPKTIELRAFLNRVLGAEAPKARAKGLALQHQCRPAAPDDDIFIRIDGEILTSILKKILQNAIKYTDDGSIKVTTHLTPTGADAIELQIDIADTGRGIPEPELETVFEAFEAAARSGQATRGLGLGLSYARAAASQLGGTLTVHSELGKGSTFSLKVPVVKATRPQPLSELTGAPDTAGPALRCLVAEDNPVNQIILTNLLERAGHSVLVVGNGMEALSEALRSRFDVILLDINMPEMRGDEACRKILEGVSEPLPRMVAVTANTLPEQVASYHAAGFQAVVGKPIKEEKLYEALVGLRPVGTATPREEDL